MKSKLPALTLLFILSFLLTACTLQDLPLVGKFFGGGGDITKEPVTLNIWGLWEEPEVMAALASKYQELHPNVTINYDDRSVLKPLVEYKERVFARVGTDAEPDIVRVHNSWMSSLYHKLAPMPGMSADTYANTFYPVAVAHGVFGGKVYGIPAYYDGLVLLYNKQHFKEIGQLSPPTAWEEFRRLALELTIRSGEGTDLSIVRAGAAMGNAVNNDHFSDILGLMWSQAGITIPDEIDTEAAEHALIFYTNFMVEDEVWDDSFPEATAAFANGQVSMIFVPSWKILDVKLLAPGLDFGVAPVPQALPQSPASWGTFWMDVVSSTSTHPDVAWDFLDFVSQEEQQRLLFSESMKYREFGAPYARMSLGSELSTNSYLAPFLETAPIAKSAEIAGRSGNRRQVNALADVIASILHGTPGSQGEATIREHLTTAKKTIIGN